jgi:DNA-directed RNA polymerase specialized sigma24 family protein
MPPWVRRSLAHLRGVKSEFWKKPNLLRLLKEVNPQYANPELERLLEFLQQHGYLKDQHLTSKALLELEQLLAPAPSQTDVPDTLLEDFVVGMGFDQLANKHGVSIPAIEKRLERALERGELEPQQCIAPERLEQVRPIAEETGFSPLSKLANALPTHSKLELKAARMLIE